MSILFIAFPGLEIMIILLVLFILYYIIRMFNNKKTNHPSSCPMCGNKIESDSLYCEHCGHKI